MDIELLRQFSQGLLALHSGQGHFALKAESGSGARRLLMVSPVWQHRGCDQAETPLIQLCKFPSSSGRATHHPENTCSQDFYQSTKCRRLAPRSVCGWSQEQTDASSIPLR
jgi:hypothetical protein